LARSILPVSTICVHYCGNCLKDFTFWLLPSCLLWRLLE
jgi:hypothetical protein